MEGRISELLFDNRGTFEGFVLHTRQRYHHAFYAKERKMELPVRRAWEENMLVRLVFARNEEHKPMRVILVEGH